MASGVCNRGQHAGYFTESRGVIFGLPIRVQVWLCAACRAQAERENLAARDRSRGKGVT